MSIRMINCCVAGLLIASIASTGTAQDPRAPLPSDTGRMSRGYADFSRYTTPGMCRAAVNSLMKRIRRSGDKDTVSVVAQYSDTLPTIALDAGKTCARRFTVSAAQPLELLDLQHLSLLLGDDKRADSVTHRRLALVKTAKDSARVLQQSVSAYLSVRPIRLASARATLDWLERLGTDGRESLLVAQGGLLQVAADRFDVPAMRQISTSMLTNAERLPSDSRDALASPIKTAWRAYLDVVQWEVPDSVVSVRARMDQEVALLRNGRAGDWFDAVRVVFEQHVRPAIGKPVVPFSTEARYIYPTATTPELRTGLLPRDTVHLVMFLPEVNLQRGILQRLHDKYGTQGLRITVVCGTKGYTQWNRSGVLSPAEEGESLRQATEQMRLPVSLVVEEVPYTFLPDGRRNGGTTQWQMRTPAGAMLVDRAGVLNMGFFWAAESVMDAYIQRALSVRSMVQERRL